MHRDVDSILEANVSTMVIIMRGFTFFFCNKAINIPNTI